MDRNLSDTLDRWQRTLRRSSRPEDREFADEVFAAYQRSCDLEAAAEDFTRLREHLGAPEGDHPRSLTRDVLWSPSEYAGVVHAIDSYQGRALGFESIADMFSIELQHDGSIAAVVDRVGRLLEVERAFRAACDACELDPDSTDAEMLVGEIENLKG